MFIIIGNGINRTISISNTRKITANRKNRKEKGKRAVLLVSNPHSKAASFSRSCIDRAETINITTSSNIGIKIENVQNVKVGSIHQGFINLYQIKSLVLKV